MADKFFLDLRDYSAFDAKVDALIAAVSNESDLTCALIATAYIDKCLLHLLKSFFVKRGESETGREVLKAEALLDSLQNRARLAYLLGLINSLMLTTINGVTTIRNCFAHSDEPLAFDTPDIVAQCNKLPDHSKGFTIGKTSFLLGSIQSKSTMEARNKFVVAAFTMVLALAAVPMMVGPLDTPFADKEKKPKS